MWIVALKNLGSFDACGPWQRRQSIAAAAMARGALPKLARSALWHSRHVGWMARASREACGETCGVWQRRQSRAAGWWAFSLSIRAFRSLWQLTQSSGLRATRSEERRVGE